MSEKKNDTMKSEELAAEKLSEALQSLQLNNKNSYLKLNDLISKSGIDQDSIPFTSKSSLLHGILMIETYGLHNIRYYSPFVDREFLLDNMTYLANPIEDSSNLDIVESDEFCNELKEKKKLAYAICRLFPSVNGSITISKSNIHEILTNIKYDSMCHKDLEILAGLLFCVIHKENGIRGIFKFQEFSFSLNISSNDEEFKIYTKKLDKIKINIHDEKTILNTFNTILNIETDHNYDIFSPSVILKAYIAYYIKNQYELKAMYEFYSTLQKRFHQKEPRVNNLETERKIIKVLTTIESQSLNFPYRKSFEELPHVLVPLDRDIQKHLRGYQGYWNCVENSLYHFLNCILWDADKNAYIKVNTDSSINIIDQIFAEQMRGTPDGPTLEKWHKLVENLSEGRHAHQTNERCKIVCSYEEAIEKVFYVEQLRYKLTTEDEYEIEDGKIKSYNYEVETGFINFIKVIEILLDKKGKLIRELEPMLIRDTNGIVKSLDTERLSECMLKIIEMIVGPEHSKHFQVTTIKAYYSCSYSRNDIYGKVRINRFYPNKNSFVEFVLNQDPGHAFVLVDTIKKPSFKIEDIRKEVLENIQDPGLQCLINYYIEPYIEQILLSYQQQILESNKNKDIHALLLGFRLEANEQTNILLAKLYNRYAINETNPDTSSNEINSSQIKSLCMNIVKSMPLYDPDTLEFLIFPISKYRDFLTISPIIVDESYEDSIEDIINNELEDFNYRFLRITS